MPRPKPKKSLAAKTVAKKAAVQKTRKLKYSRSKLFRRHKKVKRTVVLPSAWQLFKVSTRHLRANWKIFGAILLVYLLLTMVLVRGFGFTSDLDLARKALEETFNGPAGKLAGALGVFSILAGTGNPNSPVSAAFQSMIVVIVSLAIIWTLRQTHAREKVTLKDSFYKSTYPLIPFLLVLTVIAIQLFPMVIASFVSSQVISSGIAINPIEKIIAAAFTFGLYTWSIYMVTSSFFALFIVTLPDMTPRVALKSAKDLVRFRHWTIIRKTIFLPVILLVLFLVIMFPIILTVTVIAEPIFLVLTMAALIVSSSYMYTLYRELL